jgi:hypothetical protein
MPIPNEDESALGQQLHGHVGNRLIVQLAVPQGDLSAWGKHKLTRASHASEARLPTHYASGLKWQAKNNIADDNSGLCKCNSSRHVLHPPF